MALINLRNALMAGKRLPYDAEVEYLESSGTQYIDTNTIDDPVNNIVQITFSIPTSTGATMNLFGSSGSRFNYVSARWGSNRYNLGPSAATTPVLPISVGDIHVGTYTLTNNALTYTLDGVSAVYSSSLVYDDLPLAIFCIYGRPYTAPFIGRVYSFKVIRKSDGTVIADFIPVRKKTVGYLYDRVTRKLFGNAGTGDFVLGQDVVPVEYIESHGTEWIDTGVIPDDTTGVEIVHTICPNNATDNIIFGARQDSGNTRYWSDIDWGAYDSIGWGFNSYSGNADRFAMSASDVGRVVTNSLNYMNDRAGKIDGVIYDSSLQSKTLATMNRSIYLFGANNMGTIAIRGRFKVYSTKISKGQTLTNNFRPVRVGTEGAMIDTLTRRIYRNAGTGAFGYGNDLKYPIPAE